MIQENRGSPTKPFSKCQQNGFYSDPKNCAAYYICKNGLNYHLSCGNNLMFNPLNGKCDQVNQQKCRPGEQIYIPSNLKDVEVNVRSEQVKEKLKDNRAKVIHLKWTTIDLLHAIFVLGGMLCYKLGILQEGRWKICT